MLHGVQCRRMSFLAIYSWIQSRPQPLEQPATSMARYIVRPRGRLISTGDSLATVSLSPQARAAQLDSVRELRNNHPALAELGRWLNDQPRTSVRPVSTEAPILGTIVLDMDEDHAAQIPTIADLLVIEDRPFELIRPRRASGAKNRVTARDLWHLRAIGLTRARGAKFDGDGAGVTVAVLDTGIDARHAEFQGKMIDMITFDVDTGTSHSTQPSIDTEGHGTHVAGLLAGRRVGVAPSATIINGIMIPDAKGSLSHFVLALEWAASRADVAIVNMSAGIPGYVEGMEDAIADLVELGVLPVIAVGNEGRDRTRSPGNFNSVLSVGASTKSGAVASFSGSGTYTVDHQTYRVPDLVAPGQSVTSSVQGGGYERWGGTSMATPIVSGVAALIVQRHGDIPLLELTDALVDTCKDLGVSMDRQGAGIVQVSAAIADDLDELSGSNAMASRPKVSKRSRRRSSRSRRAPAVANRQADSTSGNTTGASADQGGAQP